MRSNFVVITGISLQNSTQMCLAQEPGAMGLSRMPMARYPETILKTLDQADLKAADIEYSPGARGRNTLAFGNRTFEALTTALIARENVDVLRPHQGLAVVEVGRGQATAQLADIVETAAVHPLLQAFAQHRDVVRSVAEER